MSSGQQDAVYYWLREAADMIGLKDWQIMLDSDGPGPHGDGGIPWATVAATSSYPEAVVRVSASLLLQPEHKIKVALTHELCHLFHSDLLEALDQTLELVEIESHRAVIRSLVVRYIEATVDRAARALVDCGDLPSLDAVKKATDERLSETRAGLTPGGGIIV